MNCKFTLSILDCLQYATYVDEEDEHLIEVGKISPRFNVEAKLLLKVTTKADLLRKREGGRRGRGSGKEGEGSGER